MLQDELAAKLGVKKSQLSKFKARGCPMDDVGKAKNWIGANIRPRGKPSVSCADPAPCAAVELPPIESPAPAESCTVEARLDRARRMEIQIYETCKTAVSTKAYGQLSGLLASYQKALQAITEAESTALQSRIDSAELVHRDSARAIMSSILTPIINSLDLLPITERTRCNPQKPEVAEATLRAWKDALLLRVSQAATKF